MLLGHVCTSVTALQEGLNDGRVALFPMDDDAIPADPTGLARLRVTRLLDEWVSASDDGIVAVADQQMPLSLMTGVAALEIAVHGWDVAQASGHDRPIPPDLAADLLAISRLLVPDGNRRDLFAPPVATSATASPGEELVGYLGRPVAAAAD